MDNHQLFDLRSPDGIDAAEANLNEFEASIRGSATELLLPWGLIVGRRRMLIAQARAALAESRGRG